MVDDHTRMAYSEALDSQDGPTCAGFMLRAAHWFATYEYRIDRVMTDNAMAYRPQTNGKVERFHQTLLRGWAYKQPYTTGNSIGGCSFEPELLA